MEMPCLSKFPIFFKKWLTFFIHKLQKIKDVVQWFDKTHLKD